VNKSQKFVWRLVGALIVIFFGGWICGGTLNMAAALSPQMVSNIDCPAGATGRVEWKQLSFNEYGDKTMTVTCLDSGGNTVAPLTDAQSKIIENRIFYPAGVAVMAVLAVGSLLFWSARAKRGTSAAISDSTRSALAER
jgi:hypothetical protein